MKPFVKVVKVKEPWESAYELMNGIVEEDLVGKKVLLKPNVGFDGPAKTGLCTHPEVIRGLIRYFKDKGAKEVIVGDSSVIGVNTVQALHSAGIYGVCEEEGVTCMDLNDSSPVEMKIKDGYVVDSILLSSIVYDVDIVVSVGVMKTHMHTGASLSIKNMKGAMYKREKNKLHRLTKGAPEGATEKALDYGILDLTTICYPDYAVVDGVVGVEGFGPSGGTPRPFGILVASKNPVACDMVCLKLMGIPLENVGHVKLVAEREGLTYEDLAVEPENYGDYAEKFLTPEDARLQLNCDNLIYVDESACSACHATLTQFLRYHSDKFKDDEEPIYIFAGKDLDEEEIKSKGDKAYLLGACTSKFRHIAPYCKGCPPVTSELLKLVKKMTGVTVNYLGHSAFNIATKDYRILIDPFISKNDLCDKKVEEIDATHICVSHGHENHVGDTIEIKKNTDAEVYCTEEVGEKILGEIETVRGNIGGIIKTEFGSVKFVSALHSSGVEGGVACGFLLDIEGIKVYHAGDTGLSMDMKLLAHENIDIALLPIGGTYTMDIHDAVDAVEMIKPKIVIPMHYNTHLRIQQDPNVFKNLVEQQTDFKVQILNPGEFFTYSQDGSEVVANATWEGGIL